MHHTSRKWLTAINLSHSVSHKCVKNSLFKKQTCISDISVGNQFTIFLMSSYCHPENSGRWFLSIVCEKGRKWKREGCVWVVVHLVEWTQEHLIKSDAVKPSKCHWQMEKYLDSVATCTPLHIRKQQVKSGHGILTNVTFSDYVFTNHTPSVYIIELVSSGH